MQYSCLPTIEKPEIQSECSQPITLQITVALSVEIIAFVALNSLYWCIARARSAVQP